MPESEVPSGDVVVAGRISDFRLRQPYRTAPKSMRLIARLRTKQCRIWSHALLLKAQIGEWGTKERTGVDRPVVESTHDKFVGPPEWVEKGIEGASVLIGPTGVEIRRQPIVTSAAVGSGNMLQKDPALLKEWLIFSRDSKAIEMELPGFYEAARDVQGDRPVLAIRGISDIVGFKRSSEWTAYACLTAASFAYALIVSDAID